MEDIILKTIALLYLVGGGMLGKAVHSIEGLDKSNKIKLILGINLMCIGLYAIFRLTLLTYMSGG